MQSHADEAFDLGFYLDAISVIEDIVESVTAHTNDHNRSLAAVDVLTMNVEAHMWEHTAGPTLGPDQVAFIRRLTTSGTGFGLAVGPAGTGRTTALTVACRACEAYEPGDAVPASVHLGAAALEWRRVGVPI